MGPLNGLRVVELEGLGPVPFCGMLLADMGAEVISITRKSTSGSRATQISERGKKTIALDLKNPQAVEIVLDLCRHSDALIEGFRPGVMERLGLGPHTCLARNQGLVYGRMTGWGQTGPLANAAGHDINYISLSGVLHAIGRKGERPVPPLNLVGDYGGGGMFLAFGVICAVWEAQRSGHGQVIDASMVEGSALLMHMMYSMLAAGQWRDERGVNLLDGGAYFYNTYETADGKYISVGPLEPQFFQLFVELAELDPQQFQAPQDSATWRDQSDRLAALFKRKTRSEWCEILEGTDACFAPVLSMEEAFRHQHNVARNSFIEVEGVTQPAPAPRFSRTAPGVLHGAKPAGSDTESVLRNLGYDAARLSELRAAGVLT